MKHTYMVFFASIFFTACNTSEVHLEERIEVLNQKIEQMGEPYKRGLGSMMNEIQIYHTKLYFATKNKNIELMSYVLHELEENFEDVVNVHKKHGDIQIDELVENTVLPALKEFEQIVENNDTLKFRQSFEYLTVTCNKCHVAAEHNFIRIINPSAETFLNQDFSAIE